MTTPTVAQVSALLAALNAKEGEDYIPEFTALMNRVALAVGEIEAALWAAVTGISTTSLAIGTGEKALTLAGEDDKLFMAGMLVRASADESNAIVGTVVSFDSGTRVLTLNVAGSEDVVGSGTYEAWTVVMTGAKGPPGPEYWNPPRVVTNADSPVAAESGDIIIVRTSTGPIEIDLPATGRVKISDVDRAAALNNVAVNAPDGDTATFDTIDTNGFSGIWQRRPGGTIWDLI